MSGEVKLLDAVALLEDVQEVEFCDDRGRAYAFASLHAEQLLVLYNQGKQSMAA